MTRWPTAPWRRDAERTIAIARVVLACSALIALWLDPEETGHRRLFILHAVFATYALLTWVSVVSRPSTARLPLFTHIADIITFSLIHVVALSSSSPYFAFFIFSLFCAAIRWGWRGTLWTTIVVGATYLVLVAAMARVDPPAFDLNRIIVRTVYLAVTGALLIYLSRHEEALRQDIERLARWPVAGADDDRAFTERLMRHASRIVAAPRVIVRWEAGDEPNVRVIDWTGEHMTVDDHAPDRVPAAVEAMTADPRILSGTFATDRVSGRVMFPQLPDGDTATGALVSIVAREIGASLDQLYGTRQLRELATREERIRVARDLHDGVLQSLTGVRLEIRALASREVPDATRDRLFAIERALAIEQRELRLFIGSLRPTREPGSNVLAERLDALRERIALEWKTPVTIRVTADPDRVPASIVDAVPLMVHEAVVNALKHAAPSRVSVAIEQRANELLIVVADDGHGFPFRGRLTHEQLRDLQDSPRSLIERVNSLGGRLLVESTNTGSRVEMHLRM